MSLRFFNRSTQARRTDVTGRLLKLNAQGKQTRVELVFLIALPWLTWYKCMHASVDCVYTYKHVRWKTTRREHGKKEIRGGATSNQ